MSNRKNKELLTPELLAASIAIVIAVAALWLVIENKPVMSGYKEVDCHRVQRDNGSSDCIIKLNTPDEEVRIFKGAR